MEEKLYPGEKTRAFSLAAVVTKDTTKYPAII
jgi:hypothetical protein